MAWAGLSERIASEPACPSQGWDPFCHSREGGCDRVSQRGTELGVAVRTGSLKPSCAHESLGHL